MRPNSVTPNGALRAENDRKRVTRWCYCGTMMSFLACGSVECPPPVAILPLRVDVTHATTGETLCDVRVTARSGDREEVLNENGECRYSGGWGPDVYDVTAEKDGFAPSTTTGVRVRDFSEECTRWEVVHVPMELTPLVREP